MRTQKQVRFLGPKIGPFSDPNFVSKKNVLPERKELARPNTDRQHDTIHGGAPNHKKPRGRKQGKTNTTHKMREETGGGRRRGKGIPCHVPNSPRLEPLERNWGLRDNAEAEGCHTDYANHAAQVSKL